eukprot:CAMPEP_0185547976 /NCGR_PEP_ID=MMETSP1381-20130426/6473_1 /TAXON_ID=298111 /ORGANISM="Pavlova sp., Strain CCMP459" /LENGTH=71 /DNA_ID=CAMNT_0028160563 /DNA_START=314 /DNA_END=527 /DNA_ORIENTATION=+
MMLVTDTDAEGHTETDVAGRHKTRQSRHDEVADDDCHRQQDNDHISRGHGSSGVSPMHARTRGEAREGSSS